MSGCWLGRFILALGMVSTAPLDCPHPKKIFPPAAQNLAPCSIAVAPPRSTRYHVAQDGARIHYKIKGNPRASRTLVFLHGFAADAFHWFKMLDNNPSLLRDHRVVLVTLRGHGMGNRYSELGRLQAREYYPAIVADVAGILDREGIGSAVVVGHSMGGEIARFFYVAHPARVEGLVLVSSYCRFPLESNALLRALKMDAAFVGAARVLLKVPGLDALLDWYKRLLGRGMLSNRLRWAVRRLSNSILFLDVDPEHFDTQYLPVAFSTSFKAYLLGLEAMGSFFNGKSKLPIRAPALIVHGNGDALVWPIEAELLREQIPGADVHFCQGRHFPHFDPVKFPRLINGFLDSLDERRARAAESAC